MIIIWTFFFKFFRNNRNCSMSWVVTENFYTTFKVINIHNSNYVLFFNVNLKPKHHILTHYPSLIPKSGPFRYFWCFRYEAKHKELEIYARAITSRKNIFLTLAIKYQLKFAHYLLNQDIHKYFSITIKHKIDSDLEFLSNTLNIPTNLEFNSFISYSKIDFKGTVYKIGNYVCRFKHDICLYEIVEIVKMNDSAISFIVH